MRLPKATEMAHYLVGERLKKRHAAVDATAGNGHDTLFLARAVGGGGKVFAIDVQSDALGQTAGRLREAEVKKQVELIEGSHVDLPSLIPTELHGEVSVVMFNLGYLPGGDKSLTTKWDTTLPALRAGLQILRAGGLMTVVCYPGHAAGAEEANAVSRWVQTLDQVEVRVARYAFENTTSAPPLLFALERL